MSDPLPGSPAKLERVERHLSRQRGAGVRNLATSFGFSFALSAAPTPAIEHPQETPAKRRKSAHAVAEEPERAAEKSVENLKDSTAGLKPRVRRRLEAVAEDETTAEREDGRDSLSVAVKKKGRPKKTKIHVEAKEVPLPTTVPERRPRRNAAASALVKVAEGFAEEASSIDKKRRDPEPEKPARRGCRKTAPTDTVEEAVLVADTGDKDAARGPLGDVAQDGVFLHADNATLKTTARPSERKRKVAESTANRIPLGESHVNIQSKSPEKRSESAGKDLERKCSPTSPIKKVKARVTNTKRNDRKLFDSGALESADGATVPAAVYSTVEVHNKQWVSANRRRKFDEEGAGHQSPAEHKNKSKAAAPRLRKPARVEATLSRGDCQTAAEMSEDYGEPRTVAKNDKASTLVVSQKMRSDAQEEKVLHQTRRSAVTKLKTHVKPTERVTVLQGEEDVDWLFETTEQRNVPARQAKKRPTAKRSHRAKSPDVDLDEMLSSIAAWAPKHR